MKLTQEELNILENAPEGAEFYSFGNMNSYECYYKDDFQLVHCSHNRNIWEENDTSKDDVSFVALADLRNKQGKAVIDAVNGLMGDLNNGWDEVGGADHSLVFEGGDYFTVSWGSECKVCTIEEFNQCVKDMTNTVSDDVFCEYSRDKTPLEPEQKPVEWVNGDKCVYKHHSGRVNNRCAFVGRHPHVIGKSFVISDKSGIIIVDNSYLSKPVTKEKRYISYDKHGKFISETNVNAVAPPDWQTFVVEVSV